MPKIVLYRTTSEEETFELGKELAADLRGVVLLSGDLGAGKTTLVRGIVSGVEGAAADEVSSPTFTLIHDYGAGVFHIDLYRLEKPEEIDTLGLEEIFDKSRLVLIEWGERLGTRTPARRTKISVERRDEENERLIFVTTQEDADVAVNGAA